MEVFHENVEQHVRESIERIFFDNISTILNQDKLNKDEVAYIVELYEEIKDGINQLTPNRKDLHAILDKQMDKQIFENMLLNNAFDAESMIELINVIFDNFLKLEAPYRDENTKNEKQRLFEQLQNTTKLGDFVAEFMRTTYSILDDLHRDRLDFLETHAKDFSQKTE